MNYASAPTPLQKLNKNQRKEGNILIITIQITRIFKIMVRISLNGLNTNL
jgi:hypothetical protein